MKKDNIGASPARLPWPVFALLGAAAMAYAVVRAVKLSFTFDEAATYISYLSSNILSVLDFTDANNHVLYTLFARLTSAAAGPSELVLRLPSLFGFGLYLWFSWKIVNRFFGRLGALAGFLILNLNPYVLDFFSLGRGYGLALGLEMAAVYFFLRYLDSARAERADGERTLEAALLAGCGAALANVAFLNVLLSMWVFLLLFFLITRWVSGRRPAAGPLQEKGTAAGRAWVLAAAALAVPFNLLAVAQYVRLSGKLIEPVTVRVHGLDAEEIQQVLVAGDDIYGREDDFSCYDGLWTTPKTIGLKRLKLGVPAEALEKLQQVDVEIAGARTAFGSPEVRKWKHFPREGLEFFLLGMPAARKRSVFSDMSEIMNWKGDSAFLKAFAGEAAPVLVFGALFLGLVLGSGGLASRWRLLRNSPWRPVRDSVGLGGLYLLFPIFVMKKSGALYYGGKTGFIKDTLGSLISDSFYGVRYGARQGTAVLMFVMATIVLFLLMLVWQGLRKKNLVDHLEGLAILAVLVISALFVIAQRAVFGNPYIMGRTAIFYIPLYSLFLLFLFRDLGRFGGAWGPAAHALLAAVVALSVYHGIRTANLTHTLDWYYDADTKPMVKDIVSLRARDPEGRASVRLGVDWPFWPSSEYYKRTERLSWLDISMLPTQRRCNLYYLSPGIHEIGSKVVIRSYRRTGNVLVE